VAVGDEPGYADAILGLLADPATARRMGVAGREHVLGTFSLDRLVDDVDGLYRQLIAQGPVVT
jgi:glycosyltransferase involved in cell wall biosynthesis